MITKANAQTIREAVEAARDEGRATLLEADYFSAEESRSLALTMIRERDVEDAVETWVVDEQWLHVGPLGHSPAPD